MASLHDSRTYEDACFMACCDDLGKIASSAEYDAWLAMPNADAPYPDEPPFDDGPLFEPTADDLDWLLSQRGDCLGMPETLAELDRTIGAVRRALDDEPLAVQMVRFDEEDSEFTEWLKEARLAVEKSLAETEAIV